MSGEAILLRGGRVVDPSRNLDQTLDVLLRDGVVAKVDEKIAARGAEVARPRASWSPRASWISTRT